MQLKTEAHTLDLGARIASVLVPGDIVLLSGDLGAGKTTLARGIIQSRLGNIEVPSPTYTLVQAYDWPTEDLEDDQEVELWHCDLYRLEHPDDAYELGLIDAMGESIVIIEWAEKLGSLCPPKALEVGLAFDGEGRTATMVGWKGRNV